MTLPEAVEFFLLDQQLRGNTDKTISGYRGFLRRFCEWLADADIVQVANLTIKQVNAYQIYINQKPAERGRSAKLTKKSVQTYMRHIKCFLAFCHVEGYLQTPVHTMMRTPKAERPVIEILTDDELTSIFTCFKKTEQGLRNTAMVMLMVDCGLRLAEVAGIRSEDINFQKGYITVMGKGRKGRIVPVGIKARRALLAYVHKRRRADAAEDDVYFFLTKARRPMTSGCIALLMGRLKKESGIQRLHAHLLRHTFATNFLVHGIGDVYELSRILGHSELKITESYLQLASYYTIIEKRRRLSYMDMQR